MFRGRLKNRQLINVRNRLIWIIQVILFPFQVVIMLLLLIGSEIIHFLLDLFTDKEDKKNKNNGTN